MADVRLEDMMEAPVLALVGEDRDGLESRGSLRNSTMYEA
jgi:hypothetical protein